MNDNTKDPGFVDLGEEAEAEPTVSCPPTDGSGSTSNRDSASRDEENPSPENQTQTQATSSSLVQGATGPRTPEGKQRSKYNALKHGIFSNALLPDLEYKVLIDGLVCDLLPVGKLEEVLVEKLATLFWRLRRLLGAESAETAKTIESIKHKSYDEIMPPSPFARDSKAFQLMKQHASIAALVPPEGVSERLLRYEASLERSIDRTLNQLERRQRMRLGQPVPPTLKVELSR